MHCPIAHQPKISTVGNHGHTHLIHQFIEALSSVALESRVSLAINAHPVDDLTAIFILLNHFGNLVGIILQISINRNHNVRIPDRRRHPCQQS